MKIFRVEWTPTVLARTAILAAIIVSTNLALHVTSFNVGPLNIRIGDALLMLVFYSGPWAVWAFAVGGTVSNLLGSPLGLVDVLFGGIALSFIGGYFALRARTVWGSALAWTLTTGIGVSAMLTYLVGLPFLPLAASITASNAIVLFAIGIPLCRALVTRVNMPIRTLENYRGD